MMSSVQGYRAVVTGANGFIGANLVRALLQTEVDVTCTVRPGADLWRIADIRKDVRIVTHDLGYGISDAMKREVGKADIVYHLAAAGVNQAFSDSASIVRANVAGTLELLEAAVDWGVERFIYCGSCFEYGSGNSLSENDIPNPMNQYAASKSAAWIFSRAFGAQHGLQVVSLRPFTAYGPFEGSFRLVPQTISKALQGSPIALTLGEQERDFVYVDDLVEAFLMVANNKDLDGETLNICTGIATSVRSMVNTILEITGSDAQPLFGSVPYRESELWSLSGNPEKAVRSLGWTSSHSVDEGIRATLSWLARSTDEVKRNYYGN